MTQEICQLRLKQRFISSIEELRENWNDEEIALYYANGRLLEWLEYFFYDELAEKIRSIENVENIMPILKAILWETTSMEAGSKNNIKNDTSGNTSQEKIFFEQGTESFKSGNHNEAMEFFRKGACLGDGKSLARLAWLCQQGKGIERDMDRAIACYLGAARLGCCGAMGELGDIYANVIGNYSMAAQWYQCAAARGDKYSVSILKRMNDEV